MGVEKLRAVWDRLGSDDLLWAVLSDPEQRGGQWRIDEFLATGPAHLDRYVIPTLRLHDVPFGQRVLDFGCGVGRLTRALTAHTPAVVGVDIAASMIDAAKRINGDIEGASFVHYDGRTLPFPDDSFDTVVSLIVLQHVPPAVQVAALLELNRVVRPGGHVLVQIPSYAKHVEGLDAPACRASIALLEIPTAARPGEALRLRTRVTNLGDQPWREQHGVKLGNHWYEGEMMFVQDDGRAVLGGDVGPGESVEVELPVRVPDRCGEFDLVLDLVQEYVAWWAELGNEQIRIPVMVADRSEQASVRQADVSALPGGRPARNGRVVPMKNSGHDHDGIEMHGMSFELVNALFRHCGSEIVSAGLDDLAGPEWVSRTYLVRAGEA
ncbi:MAG: methyltransferase domain-containing protein [Actinophytocola sp.]|nr:methyltransferase domain-containing protein [Actinophytocola sp.]